MNERGFPQKPGEAPQGVRTLLAFVGPYWKRALAALLLLCTLVFMDLAIPRLIQRIIDQGIGRHDPALVLRTAFLMLSISGLATVVAIGNNVFSVQVGEGLSRDLRVALFNKIQSFSFGNLDRRKTGLLLTRLTSDVNTFKNLVQVSLRIGTRAPLLMTGSLILMWTTSRDLALSILPLLLGTILVLLFFILKMEPLFRGVQQKLDVLNSILQENIAGIRLVKAFVRGPEEIRRFEDANRDLTERSAGVMLFMSTMPPLLTILVNIGIVTVIWAGGLDASRGNLTIGQIVAFSNYLLTTMTPLIMMGMLANVWANGISSGRRIMEIFRTTPDIFDPPDALPVPGTFKGEVAFRDVCFSYGEGCNESVLKKINLVVKPGETVAILGSTGAGKTSMVNLIPRFYDATEGSVLVDGKDVRRFKQDALLEKITVVPQETILFSGTVRENIRFGVPEAGEAEVIEAARIAQAHDFIMELPSGYDTRIEERGVNLSGGQKQRIAIARAILPKPRILILDDSTSAVDVETENRIQDSLAATTPPRTTFIVAQRISTVLRADRIVILEKGMITAQGPHEELIRSSPIYREIYASQLGTSPYAAENGTGEGGAPDGEK
ncbi:MAG: ABC transporter ATP-binding protein [Synergistales bacterium]